jgi:hypothetical protein
MPYEVDRPGDDDAGPEIQPVHGTDVPNIEPLKGVSDADDEAILEPKDPADGHFGKLTDPVTGREGYGPPGDDRDDRDLFGEAEACEEELSSRDQVVSRARDLLVAERDSAADDGDAPQALAADVREAVRRYATTEAVEFLRSVDGTALFRKAPVVTDADVEVVVKALHEAVQKVDLEVVLAIVAQLAGDHETLKTLLLIADTSSAPTRVKDLVRRFSLRGSLYAGTALMCAAGVKIGLMGNPGAEAVLGNETAIVALIAAVAALFKRSR